MDAVDIDRTAAIAAAFAKRARLVERAVKAMRQVETANVIARTLDQAVTRVALGGPGIHPLTPDAVKRLGLGRVVAILAKPPTAIRPLV